LVVMWTGGSSRKRDLGLRRVERESREVGFERDTAQRPASRSGDGSPQARTHGRTHRWAHRRARAEVRTPMLTSARSPQRALVPCAAVIAVLLLLAAGFGPVGSVVSAQAPDVAALMERAEAAYAAKKTFADGLEVKALYEAVLEADPNHVPALIRLAELAYWLGEVVEDGPALPHLEEGLTHARRAVELDDENPNAHYWTGVLMGRIGEERGILQSLFMVDDIMKAVQRTLELDPDHGGAHLLASQVYRKAPGWPLSIGNRQKALEHALEAVRLNPDATNRMLNLAEAYIANRQRDKAIETLQKVLEMPLTPGDEVTSQMDKERAAELLAELTR